MQAWSQGLTHPSFLCLALNSLYNMKIITLISVKKLGDCIVPLEDEWDKNCDKNLNCLFFLPCGCRQMDHFIVECHYFFLSKMKWCLWTVIQLLQDVATARCWDKFTIVWLTFDLLSSPIIVWCLWQLASEMVPRDLCLLEFISLCSLLPLHHRVGLCN